MNNMSTQITLTAVSRIAARDHHDNSSSSAAFASFRSRVSKPSAPKLRETCGSTQFEKARFLRSRHRKSGLENTPERDCMISCEIGLWDEWKDKATGEVLKSCTMLITNQTISLPKCMTACQLSLTPRISRFSQ